MEPLRTRGAAQEGIREWPIESWTILVVLRVILLDSVPVAGQEYPGIPSRRLLGIPTSRIDMIVSALGDVADEYMAQPLVVVHKSGATEIVARALGARSSNAESIFRRREVCYVASR